MDTIFALATAQGKAGVSIIRISGPNAENAVNVISNKAVPIGRPCIRRLISKSGVHIDEAMVLRFEAPNSFTGEDVVELNVHGSIAVVQAMLRELNSIQIYDLPKQVNLHVERWKIIDSIYLRLRDLLI